MFTLILAASGGWPTRRVLHWCTGDFPGQRCFVLADHPVRLRWWRLGLALHALDLRSIVRLGMIWLLVRSARSPAHISSVGSS